MENRSGHMIYFVPGIWYKQEISRAFPLFVIMEKEGEK